MGIAGVAALAAGVALTQQNDARCPGDGGGGNNCDGVSGVGAGAFVLTLTGVTLLPYAIVFGIVGASGMEKHSPEAERREQARAERQRIERERVAREQREAAERERERERAARDKARRRNEALVLLKSAVKAAHADQCSAAFELEKQIRDLDADVHDVWFVHDPDIKRCLAPSPPPPSLEP